MDRDEAHEEVLTGGNMTTVVRVGDTVRRTSGPWTPTIHALMNHLHDRGFTMVPRPLGIDERGREIISLLPGAPATYPLPRYAWSEATLVAVAKALRAFHDASVGFVAPPGGCWQWPTQHPVEVICHTDFAPYNLMFVDGELTGVIDLDLACPGPRLYDIAYTAYRFAPLTDPTNPDAPFTGESTQLARLATLCTAYGLAVEPRHVVRAAAERLRELVAFIERRAAAGDVAQQAVLTRGDVGIYERDLRHLERLDAR